MFLTFATSRNWVSLQLEMMFKTMKYVGLSGFVALILIAIIHLCNIQKLTYVIKCNNVLNTEKPCFISSICIIISTVIDFCWFQKLTYFAVTNDVLNGEIVCLISCSSCYSFFATSKNLDCLYEPLFKTAKWCISSGIIIAVIQFSNIQ